MDGSDWLTTLIDSMTASAPDIAATAPDLGTWLTQIGIDPNQFTGLNLSPGDALSLGPYGQGPTQDPSFWSQLFGGAGGAAGGLGGALSSPLLGGLLGSLAPALGMIGGGRGPETQTRGTQGAMPQLLPGAQFAGEQAQQALQALSQVGPAGLQAYLQAIGGLGNIAGGGSPFQQAQTGLFGALGDVLGGMPGPPTLQGMPTAPNLFPQGMPGAPGLMGMQPGAALQNVPGGVAQSLPELEALVQKSFDPMIANIAQQTIRQARNMGFAGGADLLGGAASPLAAQALAQVPGQEAQVVLNTMLQNAQLNQSGAMGMNQAALQNAQIQAQQAAAMNQALAQIFGTQTAGAGALNQVLAQLFGTQTAGAGAMNQALTNLYGTQIQGQNALLQGILGGLGQATGALGQQGQFANQLGLLGLAPTGQFVQGQLGLLGATPYGTQQANQQQTQVQQNPWALLPNVIGGFAQGVGTVQNRNTQNQIAQAWANALSGAGGGGLSGLFG